MTATFGRTHDVFNQSSDFAGFNAWSADPLLRRLGAGFDEETIASLVSHGQFAGSREAQDLARLADMNPPTLRRFDAKGHRLEEVEYHPAYHALMRRSVTDGLAGAIWEGSPGEAPLRHQSRAARFYMTAGVECGHLCPLTMTSASIASLKAAPTLLDEWLPLVASRVYDPSLRPASEKAGVTLGMGMTEKQGGTDVRANTTRAEPDGEGWWRITGHKWFLSAPMSDAFLILAQTGEGPTCFLLPRRLDDASLNGLFIQRLKDKLGNRSNASAEVEFVDAAARIVGEEGRGIRTIIDMVSLTRCDCAIASAGLMRAALGEAVHHARERRVFSRLLIDQPQMTRVLADMALDVAAATALVFRLCRSLDAQAEDESAAAWARVMAPVTKYWVCKMAPALVYEAMECLGGNGYVEEGRLARAYREAPVNAIWEGSGSVMALDVARTLKRQPEAFDMVVEQVREALDPAIAGRTADVLHAARTLAQSDEGAARLLTEQLALAAGAAELRRLDLADIADAFARSRLGGVWRHTYGMLDLRHQARDVVDLLYPAIR